jgi:hypothetical protein
MPIKAESHAKRQRFQRLWRCALVRVPPGNRPPSRDGRNLHHLQSSDINEFSEDIYGTERKGGMGRWAGRRDAQMLGNVPTQPRQHARTHHRQHQPRGRLSTSRSASAALATSRPWQHIADPDRARGFEARPRHMLATAHDSLVLVECEERAAARWATPISITTNSEGEHNG